MGRHVLERAVVGDVMRALESRRVVVTGGSGFLGRHVVAAFQAQGCAVSAPRKAQYDLTHEADVKRMYADLRPELVVHLAAVVGGIGANRESPGRFFFENVMLGALTSWSRRGAPASRSSSASARSARIPSSRRCRFCEQRPVERLSGRDQRAVRHRQENAAGAGAGVPAAVRLQRHSSAAGQPVRSARQLRPAVVARHSGADPQVSRGHRDWRSRRGVLGHRATRRASSSSSKTAREAIVLATERYDAPEPVNIGAGFEIRIRDLAELVAELTGFEGRLVFDPTKPDGQPRRMLDVTRAEDAVRVHRHHRFSSRPPARRSTGTARTSSTASPD